MATESSSVFVAVRVRPFTQREDPACCTITVPDSTTISVLDVPALIPSSTSGGPAAGGGAAPAATAPGDTGGGGSRNINLSTPASVEALRHAYSFDKIFWSVAPSVLPFAPQSVLDVLNGEDTDVASKLRLSSIVQPSPAQRALLAQHSAVARHLPCFASPPTYDDQQRVYDFIGPRMCNAAMAGFNACLFAYGQTGSGKSYSMIGPTEALTAAAAVAVAKATPVPPPSDTLGAATAHGGSGGEQGIMPRLFADLFRRMREEREKDESVTFTVELSFLEIYCEKVRDLLAVNAAASGGGGNANYFSAAPNAGGSLRIRQHPSQGPYVEGLTHIKVRDEEGVLRHLLHGLRDRATAETNMNEHSSRSHAILQLQVTKVVADTDDATGAVVTRTRMCKTTMVDLAGSERVSQSGVSGDRFEEAKNINLSLSTLGRVIQQLSEKQSGKHVIPAYRDSVLTWLLSDSLGGNSKTIMLATVSPSAYCYQQTLNTLRFAGVAKRVVNVASVNEDRHFQQLIAELRQQIVRLTLQLESGKAAEVHLEKIEALKREKEELMGENDVLKAKAVTAADTTVLQALRKRVKELESENEQLRGEGQSLQERMLASTSVLREEVSQQRAEVLRLHEQLAKKEGEVANWSSRYRTLVISTTSPAVPAAPAATAAAPTAAANGVKPSAAATTATAATAAAAGSSSNSSSPGGGGGGVAAVASTEGMVSAKEAERAQQKLSDEIKQLKTRLHKSAQEIAAAQRARQDAVDANKATASSLDEYKVRYEESTRQLDLLHERMKSTLSLLETTRCELMAAKARSTHESAKSRAVEDALEVTSTANSNAAAQLTQVRTDYLEEKQRNVDLLLRLAQVEQERSSLKRTVAERAADTCELEQLLLEETENSERHYLRVRYHRYANELLQRFVAQLTHLQLMAGRRGLEGSGGNSGEPSLVLSAQFGNPLRLRHVDAESDGLGGEEASLNTCSSHSPRDAASTTAAAAGGQPRPTTTTTTIEAVERRATAEVAKALVAQLLFACQSEEAQGRAAVEVECMSDAMRLVSQRARLRQLASSAVLTRLAEAEDALKAAREEAGFYRQKLKVAQADYDEATARHQEDAAALQVAEMDRLRLERKVAALEDVTAELEGGRDSLIAKIAALQEQQSTWQARCVEAERVAAEVQDLMFPGSLATAPGSPQEADAAASSLPPEQQTGQSPALLLDRAALMSRARAAQDALDAKAALEQQCDDYRTELGVLRAQLEQAKSDRQDAAGQLARGEQAVQQAEARHAEANEQLMQEISTVTRDYESRIRQQQTMMNTLRHALEEETAMADLCRQSAQRAEASRQAQEEELIAARESAADYRRQEEAVSSRYLEVQAELDQLRQHYNALERQLLSLQEAAPELYVMLEKGHSDDSAKWLNKVHSEKLRLQRQRNEAQKLNSQLLEHVRDGNTRLRDVQKQLTEASFAEDSLANVEGTPVRPSPSEDEEELTMTVRAPRSRPTSSNAD